MTVLRYSSRVGQSAFLAFLSALVLPSFQHTHFKTCFRMGSASCNAFQSVLTRSCLMCLVATSWTTKVAFSFSTSSCLAISIGLSVLACRMCWNFALLITSVDGLLLNLSPCFQVLIRACVTSTHQDSVLDNLPGVPWWWCIQPDFNTRLNMSATLLSVPFRYSILKFESH